MKAYWVTAGVGVLATLIGIALLAMGQNAALGYILVIGGLIVAVMGLAMRLIMGAVGDKLEK